MITTFPFIAENGKVRVATILSAAASRCGLIGAVARRRDLPPRVRGLLLWLVLVASLLALLRSLAPP